MQKRVFFNAAINYTAFLKKASEEMKCEYSLISESFKNKKLKTKSTALSLKALLIITFTIFGFVSSTSCKAQAVVGKWKGVSTKYYYNEEYAKQIGKSTEEKSGKDFDGFDINYNADHTFIMHISKPNATEVMIMKGTWSLSGDKLTSTRELQYNPGKKSSVSTVSFNSNTMVQTTEEWPSPARIRQAITTCVKM